MTFIDIHSHYLYGVDDGIKNRKETVLALNKAKTQRIEKIVVTPHFIPGTTSNQDIELVKQRFTEFKKLADQNGIDTYLGCELLLNESSLEMLKQKFDLTINNGPYLLVEFNLAYKIDDDALARLYEYGLKYKLIIAHVERYFYKKMDLDLIKQWIDQGYLIQVNSSSFLGENGQQIKKNAFTLLKNNMIHIIANDVHRASDKRCPNLMDVYELLIKKYDIEDINELMYKNPLAVINGDQVPLITVKKIPWFKRRKKLNV